MIVVLSSLHVYAPQHTQHLAYMRALAIGPSDPAIASPSTSAMHDEVVGNGSQQQLGGSGVGSLCDGDGGEMSILSMALGGNADSYVG